MRYREIVADGRTGCIRPMAEADIAQVSVMEQTIFSRPWSAEAFLQTLEDPHTVYAVVDIQGQIAAYCGIWQVLEEGDLCNVAVKEELRGQGIAHAMLKEVLSWGREAGMTAFTLEVRAGNQAAISLYEKLGFVTEGIRRNFYDRPTEDALIMWKRQEADGTISTQI